MHIWHHSPSYWTMRVNRSGNDRWHDRWGDVVTQCSSSNIEWLSYPKLGDDECSTNIDTHHLNWWRWLQDALAIVLHTIARVSCNRHLMYNMICSEHHDLMFAIILVYGTMTIDTYHVNRNVLYDWHDMLQSFSAWHRRANLIFIGLLILLKILENQVLEVLIRISNSY